jgi:DNA-binding XRE family transcriptional regulator
MDNKEFHSFRRRFQKTQKQMSHLLGTSPKAVQSFEQGWRKVPRYIERQMGMKQNKWTKKNVKIWKEIEKPGTIVNPTGVHRINGGKCPLCRVA